MGRPMLEHIAKRCISAHEQASKDPVAEIHADWLLQRRADLADQAPREVLLADYALIDADLQSWANQWSSLGDCPPGFGVETAAYRFAGFGNPPNRTILRVSALSVTRVLAAHGRAAPS